MTEERFVEGRWWQDYALGGFDYVAPGYYDTSVRPESAKHISYEEARALVPVLEAAGLIVPRLDERLRTEDLKITHRLLDLLGERFVTRQKEGNSAGD